jgi:hypothetical protein
MQPRFQLLGLAIRLLMATAFVYYVGYLSQIWASALQGDPAGLFDLAGTAPFAVALAGWQVASGIALSFLPLVPLAIAFVAVHHFFRALNAERHYLYIAAETIRCIGIGITAFWATYILLLAALPQLLASASADASQIDIDWWLLVDPEVVFAVLGLTLLSISPVLEEASRIEAENRQYL